MNICFVRNVVHACLQAWCASPSIAPKVHSSTKCAFVLEDYHKTCMVTVYECCSAFMLTGTVNQPFLLTTAERENDDDDDDDDDPMPFHTQDPLQDNASAQICKILWAYHHRVKLFYALFLHFTHANCSQ